MSQDAVPPENELLLPLARRLAEGLPIDWDAERQQADEVTRARIDALAEIAAVADHHRLASASFDAMNGAAGQPTHWRHLTILETLGRGQFGTVYRAFDPILQLEVALKLADAEPGADRDPSRIIREARLLARVAHRHVVRVLGADQSDGRVGIWMELVRGKTLDELAKTLRFGAEEARVVGIQLCEALAAVHGQDVLHGDIKPQNVIRRDDTGDYVLVDFGVGRALSASPAPGADTAGTLVYMAPEVLQGDARSCASDIYSLGVLLFHLVSDTWPVCGSTREEVTYQYAGGHRTRLRDVRPDLPGPFIAVVESATSPRAADRYQTAAAFETALRGEGLRETRRWPVWGVALVVAVGFLGAGAWLVSRGSTSGGNTAGESIAAPIADVSLPAPPAFEIEAAFYRRTPGGRERVEPGTPLRVGDAVSLTVRTDRPVHLYVVNEDERGHRYLLFPLRSISDGSASPKTGPLSAEPIPSGVDVRVPATEDWRVTSVGQREHMLVFASIQPPREVEELLARLPVPTRGAPAADGRYRGFGSVTPAPLAPDTSERLYERYATPLVGRETARGLWVRQLVLESKPRE